MVFSELAAALQSRFVTGIAAVHAEALDPYLVVDPASLVPISTALRDEHGFDILNDLCGVDYLEPDAKKLAKAGFEPHLEVVYHVSRFRSPGTRFTMKVILPRGSVEVPDRLPTLPMVPSVAGVWRAADWHEREAFDLFGIRFTGHPNLVRILLSDDWVGHPLRKDYEFPLEYHDIRCR